MHQPARHRIGMFSVERARHVPVVLAGGAVLIRGGSRLVSMAARRPPETEASITRAWSRAVLRALRVRVEVTGQQSLPEGPAVLLPLHESFLDPPLLMTLGRPLRFIAREELFDWPRLGRVLEGGHLRLPLHPSVGDLRRIRAQSEEAVRSGYDLVVFPQASMLGVEAAFQRSAQRLAMSLGVPVVPIVISGTHRVWEHPYSSRLRFGCRVRMEILEPLTDTGETAWRSLERTMKERALADRRAPVRRFDPERDGYWDGYPYEVDPDFPDVAARVGDHRRSAVEHRQEPIGVVGADHEALP